LEKPVRPISLKDLVSLEANVKDNKSEIEEVFEELKYAKGSESEEQSKKAMVRI